LSIAGEHTVEEASMADQNTALADLKKCMTDAKGDAGKMAACQTAFDNQAGTTVTGGKVFSITDGSGVFVTDGGKVFGGGKAG
jgi:hypothetical protein